MTVYRKIYNDLVKWKNDIDVKPLMIVGARQVGKTYILEKFCKCEFKKYFYVNLFEDMELINIYKSNLSSDEKFLQFKLYFNYDIESEGTVIFIDEIQESEDLIQELKYFCERHNNLRIVCAGSLLGVKLKRFNKSFPVGKVRMLNMYPMDFEEFLLAYDKSMLVETIRNCYNNNSSMHETFHKMALKYYRIFMICGGMPESVKKMIEVDGYLIKYNDWILKDIITSYFKDMKKYVVSASETIKITKLYNSISRQISNMSNKFQYSKVESGTKSRDYELPLDWLLASNLVNKSSRITLPEIPLKGFVDEASFKLFINDIGILRYLLEISPRDVYLDNLSFYKGTMIENYVANQLIINGYSLYYWQSSGKAEVDFLLYTKDGIIPVEVKSADNVKSKSLKVYVEKYNPKYSIRISTKDFGFENNIKSVPLYAVFCIKEVEE